MATHNQVWSMACDDNPLLENRRVLMVTVMRLGEEQQPDNQSSVTSGLMEIVSILKRYACHQPEQHTPKSEKGNG
jgi:hypothetical protein